MRNPETTPDDIKDLEAQLESLKVGSRTPTHF